jgi:cell fate regulator YaaT (PSP1 superfamily)
VIVDTARGLQMGQVVRFVPPADGGDRALKSIERLATPRDLLQRQSWEARETEAMIECRARAHELGLPCKIVRAEYSFDGSLLTFLYASDDKLDLSMLRREMSRRFRTSVELRQIGPRDVAKILGGMGACGLETRCCSMFLTEFSPISIKMAKEQGISLNPEEITGMCGRLRCCLVYEYEQYVAARKSLPKRGKRVRTARGDGKVIDVSPLKETVHVLIVDGETESVVEVGRDGFEPLDELEALQKKSQAPCDRHLGGGCTCGRDRAEKAERAEQAAPAAPAEQAEQAEQAEAGPAGVQPSPDAGVQPATPPGGPEAAPGVTGPTAEGGTPPDVPPQSQPGEHRRRSRRRRGGSHRR